MEQVKRDRVYHFALEQIASELHIDHGESWGGLLGGLRQALLAQGPPNF